MKLNMDNEKRQELKKRLRQKIEQKRSSNQNTGPQLAKRLSDDPASTLMSMGVDDANILSNAKAVIQQSKTLLQNSKNKSKTQPASEKQKEKHVEDVEEEDIVEAPPKF